MSNSGILTFVSFLNNSVTPGSIDVEQSNYALAANETYQSNPIDNSAYTAQVGSSPNAFLTLTADVAMTVYYDTSSDAKNWTSAVHTYSYSPSATLTFSANYPSVEYERFRLVNGSTAATVTTIVIGLQQ